MLKVNEIVTWGHGSFHARLTRLTLEDVFMLKMALVETLHDVLLQTGEVVPKGTEFRVRSEILRVVC